jgi:glycosyltransferase involved in cell wall biosynthesis
VGDIIRQQSAGVKYGQLFESLGRQFALHKIYDASLFGAVRVLNAIQTFRPRISDWKEHFYQNIPAFYARSRHAVEMLSNEPGKFDLVFQVGVTFDVHWNDFSMPSVIYTDYTALLSSRKPHLGRDPFTVEQKKDWIMLEVQALKHASHIFTRGEFVRRSVIEDYGLPAEMVTAVGGGVNYPRLPDPVTRSESDAPVVLFIGKDFYRKGGDLLLNAFALARQKKPLARLWLVTNGPIPSDMPLDGVELISPTWDRNKVSELFLSADIFVLPSRLETWGDVLLEAMAWELPCIGVQDDAIGEIILNNETGLLTPPADVDALAGALEKLFEQQSLRLRMGQAGRRRVETKFTWDHVVEYMTDAIQRI